MGALRRKLPVTYLTMLMGTLAIAGIPFFSGFFSKDEILWKAFSSPLGGGGFWLIAFVTAGLTSFYMFRLIYLTFHGKSRVDSHTAAHLHESPAVMTVPLVILAVLSVFGGFVGVPHVLHFLPNGMELYFEGFFAEIPGAGHGSAAAEIGLMLASVLLAIIGWSLARRYYANGLEDITALRNRLQAAYRISLNKWYVDELYDAVIVQPGKLLSTFVLWKAIDQNVIDRLVLLPGNLARGVGSGLRLAQNGVMQSYALIFSLGAMLILGFVLM